MQKDSKTALIFCGTALGMLALLSMMSNNRSTPVVVDDNTVSIENGMQIIKLTANGGYTPSYIEATAELPTELHVATNGTYDCSSSLIIPALGYQANLKPTGTEIITVAATQARGILKGTCGMGMYRFEIAFK